VFALLDDRSVGLVEFHQKEHRDDEKNKHHHVAEQNKFAQRSVICQFFHTKNYFILLIIKALGKTSALN
jgi:hypothetical protein